MSEKPSKLLAFLAAELALFALATLVHRGVLMDGYEHAAAAIAEAVIATVLAAALLLSLIRPWSTRVYALAAQSFALLGTFVGITMIIVGAGPRTPPDVALHVVMLAVLTLGVVAARRTSEPIVI
jgi:hypothetical protein